MNRFTAIDSLIVFMILMCLLIGAVHMLGSFEIRDYTEFKQYCIANGLYEEYNSALKTNNKITRTEKSEIVYEYEKIKNDQQRSSQVNERMIKPEDLK